MYKDHILRNEVLAELHVLDISMQQEDVSLNCETGVVSKHPNLKKKKHFNHINPKWSHPFSFPFFENIIFVILKS